MLRCVVGRLAHDKSADVLVFGCKPNSRYSDIPGKQVGYMPQEISIYDDFTIEETLYYFGKINKMTIELIEKRIEFLLTLLDLPSNRFVANLRLVT